jgi:hypothetical protein
MWITAPIVSRSAASTADAAKSASMAIDPLGERAGGAQAGDAGPRTTAVRSDSGTLLLGSGGDEAVQHDVERLGDAAPEVDRSGLARPLADDGEVGDGDHAGREPRRDPAPELATLLAAPHDHREQVDEAAALLGVRERGRGRAITSRTTTWTRPACRAARSATCRRPRRARRQRLVCARSVVVARRAPVRVLGQHGVLLRVQEERRARDVGLGADLLDSAVDAAPGEGASRRDGSRRACGPSGERGATVRIDHEWTWSQWPRVS